MTKPGVDQERPLDDSDCDREFDEDSVEDEEDKNVEECSQGSDDGCGNCQQLEVFSSDHNQAYALFHEKYRTVYGAYRRAGKT